MIMLLMSALMIGFTAIVMSDQRYRGIDKDRSRAYYGAQSGLEKLSTDLGNLFLDNVAPTAAEIADLADHPPSIPNVTFVAPAGVTAYGVTSALISCPPAGMVATCSGADRHGALPGSDRAQEEVRPRRGRAHVERRRSAPEALGGIGGDSSVSVRNVFGRGSLPVRRRHVYFGGRIHTNGNLFLTAQDGGTTTSPTRSRPWAT